MALVTAGLTSAQTPADISIVSGNGQLVCAGCTFNTFQAFQPLIVRATDASGSPVSGATVNWTSVSAGSPGLLLSASQTTTGSDGQSSNTVSFLSENDRVSTNIVASLPGSGAAVTFTLTLGPPETSTRYVSVRVTAGIFSTLTGSAGGTGSPSIQVSAQDFNQQPVSNISVRLIPAPDYTPGASVSCATTSGAEPGSALTGDNGTATCTPIFGATPGFGTYHVLIGGVSAQGAAQAAGYADVASVFIQVAPGTPARIRVLSGDFQSANAGQSLPAPLVAEVDGANGNPLAGQSVTWSVTPHGAAALSQTTTTSDSAGKVSTAIALTPVASGLVQVTVTTGTNITTAFTAIVNVPVTRLTKAAGDGQSAATGASFLPLTVQVNTASGQEIDIPVQFAISGPGALNRSLASTDATGRASVIVTAGNTTGAITVTASSGGLSVSFNLTVLPPGPVLTPSNFVNGAGFHVTDQSHSALAPCSIGTIFAAGLAPGLQGVALGPAFPLLYQLAQVSVSFNNSQAPLFNVANIGGQQQVAFQVPCDVSPADSVPATVTVNGAATTVNVTVRSTAPGIFQYAMSDGVWRAVLLRPDGSVVSLENKAQRGELIRLYATGLGAVQPALATNTGPTSGVDSVALGTVTVNVNNSGVRVVSARRAPGAIGVDEVVFQMPTDAPSGDDIGLSLVMSPADNPQNLQFSNVSKIPVL